MANPSRDRGTRLESQVAGYLAHVTGQPVERRALHGSMDMGDIAGLTVHGMPVVVECKSHGHLTLGKMLEGLRQAEAERDNAGAVACAAVFKREGVTDRTVSRAGDQLVLTTLRDYAAHITGARGDF